MQKISYKLCIKYELFVIKIHNIILINYRVLNCYMKVIKKIWIFYYCISHAKMKIYAQD